MVNPKLLHALNSAAASLQRSAHSEVEVFRACREQIAGLGLRGGLSLLDETGEHLIVRAIAFPEWMLKTLADLERRTGRSVEGFAFTAAKVEAYREVIETGQAVFVRDSSTVVLQMLPEAAQPFAGPVLKVFGTPPAIFAPLISEGRARGVLNIVGADLTPDDVPAVAAFANHLAVALDNARLFAGLHNAEERFRTVVNNLPIILWALDGAGVFTLSEGQSLERLGLKPGEVVGRSVFEVYRDMPQIVEANRRALAGETLTSTVEMAGLAFEAQYFPLRDQTGKVTGAIGVATNITERRRAELELVKLRKAVEASGEVIFLTDREGAITYVNPEFTRLYGYHADEVVGKTTPRILKSGLIGPQSYETFWQMILNKQVVKGELINRTKDGRLIQIDGSANPILDDRGDILGFLAIQRDITERKRAEAALQESEARYRGLFENSPISLWEEDFSAVKQRLGALRQQGVTDFRAFLESHPDVIAECAAQVKIKDVNNATLKLYRAGSKAELLRGLDQVFSAESYDSFLDELVNVAEGKTEFEWEGINRTLTGDRVDVSLRWSAAPGHADRLSNVIISLMDITERKRAEAALQESEARYRILSELTSDHAYALRVEPDGRLVEDWSTKAITRITGYSGEDIDRRGGLITLIHPDDMPRALEDFDRLYAGRPLVSEYRVLTKRHQVRWLRFYAHPSWDSALNRVVRIYGAVQDVTKRKQHEREQEAIVTSAAALRTAQTRADMLPVILDQTLALVNAESAALVMRDPASDEMVVELARGGWATAVGQRLPPGEGASGHAIATGQPYVNNDVRNDPPTARLGLHGDSQAVAAIPLVAQGQIMGVITVGRPSPITDDQVRLLTAIADIAANAIHRATLHEQTERRLQRLAALRTIDMTITASLDLRVTFDVLLDQVVNQMHVDAAAVLMLTPSLSVLEYAAGRGFRSSAITRAHVRLGEGYAGRAALERRTVAVPNLRQATGELSKALRLSEEGFQAYYGVPLVAKGNVKGVLELFHRAPLAPDPEWLDFLETLAGQAAIAIDDAELFDRLQRSNDELTVAYDATLEGWSHALDLRDKETEGHTQRVTELTLRLARAAGMSEDELVNVRRGALLHDIGKMGIPDSILLKPGPLTDDEWVIMRKHPVYAYELLMPIPFLRSALDIPYCHHEKCDGTGYPRGLRGEAIPLAARLFAVVDVWDALLSNRPYRAAWPEAKVRDYMRSQSGLYFDPQVVETFLMALGGEPLRS